VKVLVVGGGGMLGHRAVRVLSARGHEVWASVRGEPSAYEKFGLLPSARWVAGFDAQKPEGLRALIERVRPAVVLNCIGIVKQRSLAKLAIPSIEVNSLFPHRLADVLDEFDARLIQISTDCVFSGSRGGYTEDDLPDPADLYGRSKLLGEVRAAPHLTLRTSIIGWELGEAHGLLEWFASQRGGRVRGFTGAIYSGLSTTALANLVADLIAAPEMPSGLFNVASEPINKYDLLTRVRDALGWQIEIEAEAQFACDRSLVGTRFEQVSGWRAPSWDAMVAALAEEWTWYEKWRRPA
jgi:dTDP-4-dehydrorhamnose reductase